MDTTIKTAGRSRTRYDEVNPVFRFMRWQAGTAPMAWFWARTLHHIDHYVFTLTRGRHTFASLVTGLPVVMLTTTGRKSGGRRTVPVLGLPNGGGIAVIASNFGRRRHPAWYYNLRAHPEAEVSVRGERRRVVAREAEGEERECIWRQGLGIYPAWAAYERRAPGRRIPVMVLSPTSSDNQEVISHENP